MIFKEIIKLGSTFHLSHEKVLCHLMPVHLHKDEMASLALHLLVTFNKKIILQKHLKNK